MKKFWAFLLAASLCGALAGCAGGSGQEGGGSAGGTSAGESGGYPSSAIQVIIPWGAGGGTDLFGRIVCEKMSDILGVPMEIVNMPGGGGTVGTTEALSAEPDGYTLEFCISTPICLTPNLGETSYTIDDVQGICNAYSATQTICVAADSDLETLDDLIAYIDGMGGKVSYGGTGLGNQNTLAFYELIDQLGKNWELTQATYDGDSDETVALMSGEVPFGIIQASGIKSAVESGNLRPILVFGGTVPRWMTDLGLDVQTSEGLGYTASVQGNVGFFGPRGISSEVITAVSGACQEALEDPEVLEAIGNIGLEVEYMDAQEYSSKLQAIVPTAKELMERLGFIQS